MRPLLYDSSMDYWCEREVDVLILCRRKEGRVTKNMCTYWWRVMNSFVDFVASREQEKVVISPPRTDISINANLSQPEKNQLVAILNEYADVFAWEYDEIPGLDPNLVAHALNVEPGVKPVI